MWNQDFPKEAGYYWLYNGDIIYLIELEQWTWYEDWEDIWMINEMGTDWPSISEITRDYFIKHPNHYLFGPLTIPDTEDIRSRK